jgi:hypothetical protein
MLDWREVIRLWAVAAFVSAGCHHATILFDRDFDTTVSSPAYARSGPQVLFDEGHRNYHTATGRYKPFVDLIGHDGYRVVRGRRALTERGLERFAVLVIASAQGPDPTRDDAAFTDEESDAVRRWVGAGGGLLLIADHYPFAGAAAGLARRFGIGISRGITEDLQHCDQSSPYVLLFTRAEGLILEHPITQGRQSSERVSRVMTFGGTSLSPPLGAVPFLKLSRDARDRPALSATRRARQGQSAAVRYGDAQPAGGVGQALALEFGHGRVVVLGEAGMLTAQRVGADSRPFGMNVKDIENRQLALNIMHWLSGLLGP